jgi:hypothetical protein
LKPTPSQEKPNHRREAVTVQALQEALLPLGEAGPGVADALVAGVQGAVGNYIRLLKEF